MMKKGDVRQHKKKKHWTKSNFIRFTVARNSKLHEIRSFFQFTAISFYDENPDLISKSVRETNKNKNREAIKN